MIKDLKLRDELANNLNEIGYTELTPIQEAALPIILEGKDLIGQAKTGSGKTAAFGLGILNALDTTIVHTQSLVLCPTRELAEQVAVELRKLARLISNVKVLTITGGVGYHHQESSLQHGAHIIVGTPGRVAKLMKTGFVRTHSLKSYILDEADRMLDMGFFEEIMGIEKQLPKERQNLLFSATFPEEILKLSEEVLHDAQKVVVDSAHEEGEIEQLFYELPSHKDKNQATLKVLGLYQPERLIIFCKTKAITDKLAGFLKKNGLFAESIHGDIDQNERRKILTKFSNNSLSVLVATDVAARGLDIANLPAVINYDLPADSEDYVHRIGRTGRAGRKGLAISLFVEAERHKIHQIEEIIKLDIAIKDLPGLDEVIDYGGDPPMRTIFISGGKKDKLRPGDILGALVKEAELEADDVGDINIMPVLTYVSIKKEKVEQAIERLSAGKIKKRKFRIGLVDSE